MTDAEQLAADIRQFHREIFGSDAEYIEEQQEAEGLAAHLLSAGWRNTTADAELVALLLAEARAKRAWDAAPLNTPEDARTFKAHVRARVALDAAVRERLEGETR